MIEDTYLVLAGFQGHIPFMTPLSFTEHGNRHPGPPFLDSSQLVKSKIAVVKCIFNKAFSPFPSESTI